VIAAARHHPLAAPLATAAAVGGAWLTVATIGPARAVPVPCPLLTLTGVACPFCGGTRAAYSLAHGDLVLAVEYNAAAVLAGPVLVALWLRWLVRRARGEQVPMLVLSNRALAIIGAGLLVFAVVRNLPFGTWLAP
jgi:hypothetical protein